MMALSPSVASRAVRTRFRWRSDSGVPASSCSSPSTPARGVRISWLMLARNSLLAWLAFSALSRSLARSMLKRSLIMRMMPVSRTMAKTMLTR